MNECENSKKVELQTGLLLLDKNKILTPEGKQWDLAKKSTQGSCNVNCDINQTQNSVNNLFGENKFKLQYETIKIESDKETKKHERRFSKYEIKIDYRRNSRLKNNYPQTNIIDSNYRNSISSQANARKTASISFRLNSELENHNSLSNNGSSSKKPRQDAYGIPITKNAFTKKKSFQVTFLDNLANDRNYKKRIKEEDFIKIYNVESYKKYNYNTQNSDEAKCKCKPGCTIF